MGLSIYYLGLGCEEWECFFIDLIKEVIYSYWILILENEDIVVN